MRRSYAVTGGAGFIGSHLVEALLARGDMVVAFDNLSTGRLRNLDRVGNHPNLRFVHGSVLDELAVDEVIHKCDVVVHLAAAVGVKLIVEEPLRSFTTNIRGSEIVIESAFRHRRPILLASTSEIYGKNTNVPLREDADRLLGSPTVARWAYSLPTTVVRLFNTVGPRQSPAYGMVVPRLSRQAAAGEPLTIYGDGSQTRCFCHVSDVVEALLGLLDNPEAVGGVFNVGSQEEISIYSLAERIIERARSGSTIQLVPYEDAYAAGFEDMQRRVPSIDKIAALTGWKPVRTLDDILTETLAEAVAAHGLDRAAPG